MNERTCSSPPSADSGTARGAPDRTRLWKFMNHGAFHTRRSGMFSADRPAALRHVESGSRTAVRLRLSCTEKFADWLNSPPAATQDRFLWLRHDSDPGR